MRASVLAAWVLAITLGWVGAAAACTSDDECPIGVRCEREPGEVYGTCTGAPAPPPPKEVEVQPPLTNPGQTPGLACYSQIDCPIGTKCNAGPGAVAGVCE